MMAPPLPERDRDKRVCHPFVVGTSHKIEIIQIDTTNDESHGHPPVVFTAPGRRHKHPKPEQQGKGAPEGAEQVASPHFAELGPGVCGHIPEQRNHARSARPHGVAGAETGRIALRMREDDAEFEAASDKIAKTLETIEVLPVLPREVEDILTISSRERYLRFCQSAFAWRKACGGAAFGFARFSAAFLAIMATVSDFFGRSEVAGTRQFNDR